MPAVSKDTTVLSAPEVARCRACDAALSPDSTSCKNCGATFAEANRCPHCRVVAAVDVRAGVGRCRVCGGPRIALDDPGIVRSGSEIPWLEQARAAALGIVITRFGSYAALAAAGFGALFSAMLGAALSTSVPAFAVLALSAAVGVLGLAMRRKWRRARKAQQAAIEQARQLVAGDILRQRPALESAELGRLLGLDPEQAELLVAELNVSALLGGPEGPIRERIGPTGDEPPISAVPETESAPRTDMTEMSPPLAGSGRRS